jgi:hypothetical protein
MHLFSPEARRDPLARLPAMALAGEGTPRQSLHLPGAARLPLRLTPR